MFVHTELLLRCGCFGMTAFLLSSLPSLLFLLYPILSYPILSYALYEWTGYGLVYSDLEYTGLYFGPDYSLSGDPLGDPRGIGILYTALY